MRGRKKHTFWHSIKCISSSCSEGGRSGCILIIQTMKTINSRRNTGKIPFWQGLQRRGSLHMYANWKSCTCTCIRHNNCVDHNYEWDRLSSPLRFWSICFLVTTSVTALHKSSFNWEGVSDECDSWKVGNAVNILEESSSTIKLLSVMAVAIKSLWAAWKLLCSTLNQQQQRIKVIIIEAAHVAVYIIATRVVFFFFSLLALTCFMSERCTCCVFLGAWMSAATWGTNTTNPMG